MSDKYSFGYTAMKVVSVLGFLTILSAGIFGFSVIAGGSEGSGFFGWSILVFGIINGVLIIGIAAIGEALLDGSVAQQQILDRLPALQQTAISLFPVDSTSHERDQPTYDRRKWEILKEVDDDIAQAARRVADVNSAFEDELAQKYLTLGEKAYLAAIERRIIETHEAQVRRETEDIEKRKNDINSKDSEFARDYIEILRNNGNREPDEGLMVAKVEQYFGNYKFFHGGLAITFEDGTIMLKNRFTSRKYPSRAQIE
jgi:hypothetical protein